jgi:hypothetical protein
LEAIPWDFQRLAAGIAICVLVGGVEEAGYKRRKKARGETELVSDNWWCSEVSPLAASRYQTAETTRILDEKKLSGGQWLENKRF